MSNLTFDSLGYFNRLKNAGVSEAQAQVQVDAIKELVENNVATKRDLHEMEDHLLHKMAELDYRLTIRLGSMIAISTGILLAGFALFIR